MKPREESKKAAGALPRGKRKLIAQSAGARGKSTRASEEFQSAIIPLSLSLPLSLSSRPAAGVSLLLARSFLFSRFASPVGPHAGYKWRHYSLIIRDTERGVCIVRRGQRA